MEFNARVHCDNKTRQIGLNPIFKMIFLCLYFPLKTRIWCSARGQFLVLLPLLRHVLPLNDKNCRLTMTVVKKRSARDTLQQTFDIGMFKCGKNNSTTIKHIYNESENLINCQLWCCFWQQWLAESPINGGNDWHGECADTRSPSLHRGLLDAGYM